MNRENVFFFFIGFDSIKKALHMCIDRWKGKIWVSLKRKILLKVIKLFPALFFHRDEKKKINKLKRIPSAQL